jgi:arylsulfatase A-like enzyme
MDNMPVNFLFIIAEDVGMGDYSCYNKERNFQTKNVDSLATNGVVFTNAYSTAALCAPARYSLLTGNYTHRQRGGAAGSWGFDCESSIKPEQKTLANILQKKGYRTGLFGKTGIGGLYNKTKTGEIDWTAPMVDGPTNWGFDYSFIIPRGHQWLPLVFLENNIPTCDPKSLIRGQESIEFAKQQRVTPCSLATQYIGWMDYADPEFDVSQVGETLLSKVEKFLDTTDNTKPFFMHFCCDGAHPPCTPPETLRGNKILNVGKDKRDDMVYETDVLLGELRKILKTRGLEENTVICFSSDHGALASTVGIKGLRGGKCTIYEGGVRVPLIVNYPSKFLQGKICSDLVCAMDILPTFLELIGVNINEDEMLDSKSLIPLLVSNSIEPNRKYLLINRANGCLDEATGSWGLTSSVYDSRWKVIFDRELRMNTPVALYDLKADPLETTNLINQDHLKETINNLSDLRRRLVSIQNTRLEA